MPELDALRGIACLMVLFFHGFANRYVPIHLNWTERGLIKVSGYGWTGVNLFFVLSGFLITGILLETRERADYYRRFYIRRALRILPAYYGILFLVAITWQLGLSDRPVSWAFLGLSSIYLANLTPLFGVPIQFGVLWSLAVEEHFYLLWPAAVRRLKERGLVILAVALCLISLGSRIAAFHLGFNVFAYYTWMVCDGLAMGALVAIGIRYFLERRGAALSIAGTALGLALTAFALEKLVGRTLTGAALQITGFNSLYACALVVALLLGSRFGIRPRPLEWVGDISYGVYLVHTLVFDIFDAMARRHFPSLAPEHSTFPVATVRFLIVAAITLACAWLSRWYFEERFLRMKDRFAAERTKLEGDQSLQEAATAGVSAA